MSRISSHVKHTYCSWLGGEGVWSWAVRRGYGGAGCHSEVRGVLGQFITVNTWIDGKMNRWVDTPKGLMVTNRAREDGRGHGARGGGSSVFVWGLHVWALVLVFSGSLEAEGVCVCVCVCACGDVLFTGGVSPQYTEASRPLTSPWSLTSVNTDRRERQLWPWVNTKANTWRQAAHAYTSTRNHIDTHIHTHTHTHTHTHSHTLTHTPCWQANNWSPLLSRPGPSSDTSHN